MSTDPVVAPVRVCRNCQAQSQTLDSKCPNCNKRFKRRKRWPWVILAIVVVFGGCAAIVGSGLDKAVKDLNVEQESHAISQSAFDSLEIGTPKAEVLSTLAVTPENSQEFISSGVLDNKQIKSSCVYFNKRGGSFGDVFQLCFDTNDKLDSKNSY